MTTLKIISSTQRVVVNAGSRSASVISAGPIGPGGPPGQAEASIILNTDGQLLTRVAGNLAPITRGSLASDAAFTTSLARRVQGAGAPGSVLSDGNEYYDTTAKRLYRSNGSVMLLISGSLPRVEATKNSTQSFASGTSGIFSYPDTEDYDTDNLHSISVNPSRITIPANLGGVWSVTYNVYYALISGSGLVQTWLQVNNNGKRYAWTGQTPASGFDGSMHGSADLVLAAGDYVEVGYYHTNGGSLSRNFGFVGIPSRFTAHYKSPT